jgi:hypothetical protein
MLNSLRFLILAATLLLGACTAPQPESFPDHKFSTIQRRVLDVSCAATCHQTGNAMVFGQLDLSAGHAYAAMVNVAAKNVGAVQDGLLRVKPGDADHSLLFIKIAGHTPIAYGTPMPQSGVPMSPAAIEAVRAWIADGAKND